MLSASAVADSNPWRRRMRYLLGVVVFATAIAATNAHTHTHILPTLCDIIPPDPKSGTSQRLPYLLPAVADVTRHCSGNPVSHVARASATIYAITRMRYAVPRLMLISIRGHLVPGPDLPVECVSRVHAVKREL
jgi:hypothetical protein